LLVFALIVGAGHAGEQKGAIQAPLLFPELLLTNADLPE